MSRSKRMCPNVECERHGQPTGLMGGCDCGTALVAYRTPDEQVNDTLNEIFTDSAKRLRFYYLLGTMDRERRNG